MAENEINDRTTMTENNKWLSHRGQRDVVTIRVIN
jgi:hypothetical protein